MMKDCNETARNIAKAFQEDILKRTGWKEDWRKLDENTQNEIIAEWARIACHEIEKSQMVNDQEIKRIAKEHLGVYTLETRNSDSLDFHDVSVWQVKHALEAAYIAGAKSKRFIKPRFPRN